MEQAVDIPGRLKKALATAEISQAQLAEKLNLSSAAVSQWLSGKKEPSGKTLREAAVVLGADPAWLEYGVGDPPAVNLEKQRRRYEAATSWVFRRTPEDGGRDYGNANLWSIPWDIETLVKESVQNSLDAALDRNAGVEVRFNLIKLTGSELDKFLTHIKWQDSPHLGLKDHIEESTENTQKLGTVLRDGLESLEREKELILLRIDDYGTRGLIGPENGSGNFPALCRNNLDSHKMSATAGGAYGLGKAVFWRASKFSTVMFCSNLSEPFIDDHNNILQDLRVIGKADLAWHKTNGSEFAGPGWFGLAVPDSDGRPTKANSVWGNQALVQDLYLDRESGAGTTILVVGFQDVYSDAARSLDDTASEFERALSKNFWPALISGRLTAAITVSEGRVQKSTSMVDANHFHPFFVDAVSKYNKGEFVDKLKEEGNVVVKHIPLRIPSRNRIPKHGPLTDEAVLIVRRASDEKIGEEVNQVAYYRGQEMVIMYQNMKMLVSGGFPFHAAVLCGRAMGNSETSIAAEQFLRSAEPPAHDKWTATPELRVNYAQGYKTNLDSFFRSVKEAIRDLVKPTYESLDDGPRALKELLRVQSAGSIRMKSVDAPQVSYDNGKTRILESGSWQIFVKVRLPDDRIWRAVPALIFAAETGGGKKVTWSIQPVSGCTIDGDAVVSLPKTREMTFIGTSDRDSHPAQALDSAVKVVLQHVKAEER